MLLSVPATRLSGRLADLHDAAQMSQLPVPQANKASSSSGGGAATVSASAPRSSDSSSAARHHRQHQQHQQHNPARRVLRALLSVTGGQRPRQQQGRAAAKQQQHQHPQHQHPQQQDEYAAAAAQTPPPPQQPPPPPEQQLMMLHSAASLPPPSPPAARLPKQQQHDDYHALPPLALGASQDDDHDATATVATTPATTSHPGRRLRHANNPLRRLLRALLHHSHRAARQARPHGPGCNDATPLERLVNVLTSAPFFFVGAAVLRSRKAPAARRFGRSFLAVGAVAAAYHACPRDTPLRQLLRKADYYAIAWSSCCLREAVGLKAPPALALLGCTVTPLKPTLVTGANLVAIEARYACAALRAGAPAHVRAAWRRHLMTAGLGLGCFLGEDAVVAAGGLGRAFPGGGRLAARLGGFNALHGAWHCLSAAALALSNALLGHVEEALLLEAAEVVVADGGVVV
jgi:hypothetical protein